MGFRYLILFLVLVTKSIILNTVILSSSEQSAFQQNDILLTSKVDTASNISSLSNLDVVIQVGAFHHEPYAKRLRDKLSALLNKPVVVINEDGYFKVRIVKFNSDKEIEDMIPTLNLLGITSIWIFNPKARENLKSGIAISKPDTVLLSGEKQIDLPDTSQIHGVVADRIISLQVAIFHKESEALKAQKIISSKLGLKVEVVEEWQYYKLLITGFEKIEDMYKYYPMLAELGYPITNSRENNTKK